MSNLTLTRGMTVAYAGKLWAVLAVTDESLFLIGTYGQIVEVKRQEIAPLENLDFWYSSLDSKWHRGPLPAAD